MSLFKTEDFWSTKCGVDEKFVSSTLCVGSFLSDTKSDQIICGSLNGFLRLYSQSITTKINEKNNKMSSDGDTNPFSLINNQYEIDLLMELSLKCPIIQLATGRFIAERRQSIAVLTPRKLILMIIDEESMSFKIVEEFTLQRTAYNCCYGNFGNQESNSVTAAEGDRGNSRESVCVQATDCTLSFYVNGHLSFVAQLASAMLPGPLCYLPGREDSIVIAGGGGSRLLEGYRYKSMALLSASQSHSTGNNMSATHKRSSPDWTVNIGENAVDILVCDSIKDGSILIVLSRYSIIVVNNNTGVILKKRFENRLRSLVNYGNVDDNGQVKYLLMNCLGELMVFLGMTLRWKAHMSREDIISVSLGRFNNLSNFIVTLSDSGHLSVVFLGTDPSLGNITVPSGREQISDDNESELNRLQQKIKTITTTSQSGGSSSVIRLKAAESVIKVTVDISSARLSVASQSAEDDDSAPSYSVDLKLKSRLSVTNVMVRVMVQPPLTAREAVLHVPSMSADKEVQRTVSIVSSGALVVCSLRMVIMATGDCDSGTVCTGRTALQLPLSLVTHCCSPCKQASFKITLDGNEDTVNLGTLFSDIVPRGSEKASSQDNPVSTLGLQYFNGGPIVTILASKKRYRLQSDHFEALWLPAQQLGSRLSQHFSGSSRQFLLTHSEALPLDSYFLVLEFHLSVRQNLQQYCRLLEERSKQFRAIEKLLLSKSKDKTQHSLQNLDTLLENSSNQLIHLSDLVEEQQHHLTIVGSALSASTSLLAFLLSLSSSQSQKQRECPVILDTALSPCWTDWPELGLEEIYSHIYQHLLTNSTTSSNNSSPQCPDNIDRLKKHIRLLCDRICKGDTLLSSLGSTGEAQPQQDSIMTEDSGHRDMKAIHSPRTSSKQKKSTKQRQLLVAE